MLFLYIVYPMLRRKVRKLGSAADPSHVYLMVTSFRIDALTTAQVYSSVIREAIDCGYPTTVVCSLVEMSDELLVKSLWAKFNPPDRVALDFVRIAGTGKRDGLAYGFRAISRHLPDENAVVAVIDGDTVLGEGVVAKTVPWFKLYPNVGGLTTNEFCEHPPEKSFIKASRKLMYRWYGNNLRQNSRALGLGVRRLGLFTSVVLFDQRVSMWTSLLGLTVALIASLKFGPAFLLVYLLWIGITRLILTLMLMCSGHAIGPAYPLILYYNQIVGAIMKIYVFFRLDKQS
uniref:Glycosyltransferase family 2 protein n=1 Tax=Steinernema glaseri TaxID=37863 RepID=A0A1I7YF33_9BILA